VLTAEGRECIPAGLLPLASIVTNLAFALYDAPLWNMALIASKLHFVWIATVCGKFKNRLSLLQHPRLETRSPSPR
jgi:hypothetical protein